MSQTGAVQHTIAAVMIDAVIRSQSVSVWYWLQSKSNALISGTLSCSRARSSARAHTHARIHATSTHQSGVYRNKLPFKTHCWTQHCKLALHKCLRCTPPVTGAMGVQDDVLACCVLKEGWAVGPVCTLTSMWRGELHSWTAAVARPTCGECVDVLRTSH